MQKCLARSKKQAVFPFYRSVAAMEGVRMNVAFVTLKIEQMLEK